MDHRERDDATGRRRLDDVVNPRGDATPRFALPPMSCPGCGQLVTPGGARCPDCDYDLAKFYYRLRWLNVFVFGILGMGTAAVFMILGSHGALRGWFGWLTIVLGVGGMVATLVGMFGVLAAWPFVFGSHHRPVNHGGVPFNATGR